MMLECLILRDGKTPVTMGNSKLTYFFMPIPGSMKGEMTTSYCEVMDENHVKYLLKTKQYREYIAEIAQKEMLERRKKLGLLDLSGFSIQKYQESGYVGIDNRSKKKRFLDSTGWKDQPINLVPFKSEFETYQSLKEELEFENLDQSGTEVEGFKEDIVENEPEMSSTEKKRGRPPLQKSM